jgi:hypothetical protein
MSARRQQPTLMQGGRKPYRAMLWDFLTTGRAGDVPSNVAQCMGLLDPPVGFFGPNPSHSEGFVDHYY